MTNESDDYGWRKQYEQAWKTLNDESTRYWTRFNISLVINAGLIIGFSTMLGFLKDSPILGLFATMSISIMGIFFSKIWLNIANIAIQWNRHYAKVIKNIEGEKLKENLEKFRIIPPKGTIKGSITETSLWYPKIFFIFWILLTMVFGIYQVYVIFK